MSGASDGGSVEGVRKTSSENDGSADVRRMEKLRAVAQLTSGIAHNFNNLLMAMLPNVEMAQPHVPLEQQGMLDDALDAGARAAEMVRKLMLFGGHAASGRLAASSASVVLDELVERWRDDWPVTMTLRVDGDRTKLRCRVRQVAFEEAMGFLIDNAREAVLAGSSLDGVTPHAEIRVGTRACHESAPLESAPRDWVCFYVQDDGVGMAPSVQDRAFEPFFTTKEVGMGLGLGLSAAYGVARSHGGWVRLRSSEGTGTTAEFLVPAVV